MTDEAKVDRRMAMWGVLLVGIGVLVLLLETGAIHLGSMREWWPAILIGTGVFILLVPEQGKQVAPGVMLILIGLWFFACIQHWYSLTYRNGWPLLVVIFGIQAVLAGLFDRGPRKKEKPHA